MKTDRSIDSTNKINCGKDISTLLYSKQSNKVIGTYWNKLVCPLIQRLIITISRQAAQGVSRHVLDVKLLLLWAPVHIQWSRRVSWPQIASTLRYLYFRIRFVRNAYRIYVPHKSDKKMCTHLLVCHTHLLYRYLWMRSAKWKMYEFFWIKIFPFFFFHRS